MYFDSWKICVAECLSNILECDYSDAEAICGLKNEFLYSCFVIEAKPEHVAIILSS